MLILNVLLNRFEHVNHTHMTHILIAIKNTNHEDFVFISKDLMELTNYLIQLFILNNQMMKIFPKNLLKN